MRLEGKQKESILGGANSSLCGRLWERQSVRTDFLPGWQPCWACSFSGKFTPIHTSSEKILFGLCISVFKKRSLRKQNPRYSKNGGHNYRVMRRNPRETMRGGRHTGQ